MLTLPYYLHCLLTVAAAICFADLLVQDGMLLAPIQRWLRERYRFVNASENPLRIHELDDQLWWKPLWGCAVCVAGQWCFWAYLWHYQGAAYHFDEHIYFVALGLIFSLFLQWLIRKLQHS